MQLWQGMRGFLSNPDSPDDHAPPASRRADRTAAPAPPGAADALRAPLSRERRHWLAALAGTTAVHALAVLGALLLIPVRMPDDAPEQPGVQVVFVPASRTQVSAQEEVLQPVPPEAATTEGPDAHPSQSEAEPASSTDGEAPPKAEPAPAAEPLQQPAAPPRPEPSEPPPTPQPARSRPRPRPATRPSPPRRQAAAPPAKPVEPAPLPASPPAGTAAAPEASASALLAWRQALAAWLAAHKTYPAEARRRGIEGDVAVRFSVDASGHVTDVVLLRGSGSPILDAGAEALLRGATVPTLSGGAQGRITISVQLRYRLSD